MRRATPNVSSTIGFQPHLIIHCQIQQRTLRLHQMLAHCSHTNLCFFLVIHHKINIETIVSMSVCTEGKSEIVETGNLTGKYSSVAIYIVTYVCKLGIKSYGLTTGCNQETAMSSQIESGYRRWHHRAILSSFPLLAFGSIGSSRSDWSRGTINAVITLIAFHTYRKKCQEKDEI